MSREIKFKAVFKLDYMVPEGLNEDTWIDKGIYNITGLHFWEGHELTSISIDTDYGEIQDIWLQDAPIDIIQYTRLKDKNGTEIYEGDLLLIPDYFKDVILEDGSGPVEADNHIEEVFYSDKWACFGVSITHKGELFQYGFHSLKEILEEENELENLGSKYTNPELLEDLP